MFFIVINTLHVSGGPSAHHQEPIKLYVRPWVLSCFPAGVDGLFQPRESITIKNIIIVASRLHKIHNNKCIKQEQAIVVGQWGWHMEQLKVLPI